MKQFDVGRDVWEVYEIYQELKKLRGEGTYDASLMAAVEIYKARNTFRTFKSEAHLPNKIEVTMQ